MNVSTLRVSQSPYCEMSCAYCKLTQSKKNATGQSPVQLPSAKNLVFPCNSFYENDLQNKVMEAQPIFQTISIELHFVTVTQERNQDKLSRLASSGARWIIHIDHLDHDLIRRLGKWDTQVIEYRVFPSKIYPVELFLRDLPPFIQKKTKWLFLPPEDISDDFTDLERTAELAEKLSHTSLQTFSLATQHWSHTVGHEKPIPEQGKHWSGIDASKYTGSDWPVHLREQSSMYLGYLISPIAKEIDSIIEKNRVSVIYMETLAHRDLLSDFRSHFTQAPPLFLLENFLVRREIWQVYLRTYSHYNHWTWSHFIKNENIQIVTLPALGNDRFSTITIEDLRRSCQEHYLQTLDSEFYNKHFNFLHQIQGVRKTFTIFMSFIFSTYKKIPSSTRRQIKELASSAQRKLADVVYSTFMFYQNIKKLVLFIFNRGFWRAHAKYWQSYHFTAELYGITRWCFGQLHALFGRIYGLVVDGFWLIFRGACAIHRGYRCLYNYTLAPTFGFLVSLFDFPEDYKHHSLLIRWRLKLLFSARKLAWLALKIVGKR